MYISLSLIYKRGYRQAHGMKKIFTLVGGVLALVASIFDPVFVPLSANLYELIKQK